MTITMSPETAAMVAQMEHVTKQLQQAQLTDRERQRALEYLAGYTPEGVADALRFIEYTREQEITIMAKHRADDANHQTGRPAGQSTSEHNGGPKHDTGRAPRHAAQETTDLTDRSAASRSLPTYPER